MHCSKSEEKEVFLKYEGLEILALSEHKYHFSIISLLPVLAWGFCI